MKEQDKIPRKTTKWSGDRQTSKKTNKQTKKKFRIIIVNMIQDLRKRMEAKTEKMQEKVNKDPKELKNKERWTIQ